MKQFKKCKVVMLPNNEKTTVNSIVTRPSDNRMAIVNVLTKDDPQPCIHQHLYILSDEEIKEGDYGFINIGENGTIGKITKDSKCNTWDLTTKDNIHYPFTDKTYIKKIITTTDKSLKIADFPELKNTAYRSLPQPSQQFIEYFISEYNKGNIITDVMVEYESIEYARPMPMIHQKYYVNELKVNPKDNTITIKKVKDSWNREEVVSVIKEYREFSWIHGISLITCNKWIKENVYQSSEFPTYKPQPYDNTNKPKLE